MKINVVTLCSGYGAQEMALDRLKKNYPDFDWELLAWAEIEPNAIKAHQSCHPEYADRNLGDITVCDYSKIEQSVDLLVYSTPCQSVSVAGQNKGMKEGSDAASALIWHTRRAIETLKPKVCILENVKGMIMGKNVKEFHKWQHVMESYGYTNFAKVLNSKDFGVPQNRERLFMVSILDCDRAYHFPEPFKLEKRIKDILEPYGTVDESFYFKPEQLLRIIAHCDRKVEEGCGFKTKFHTEDEISGCVTTRYGQRETDPCIKESALFNPMPDGTVRTLKAQSSRSVGKVIRKDGFGETAVIEPSEIREGISIHPLNRKMEFQGFKSIQSDTAPCLTAHDGRGGEPVLWEKTDRIIKLGNYTPNGTHAGTLVSVEGIAPTVMGQHGTVTGIVEPMMIQRLSLYGNNAQAGRVYDVAGISPCLDTCCGGNRMPKILTPVRTEEAKELRRKGIEVFKHRELVPREDGVSNTITTVLKDNLLQEPCILGYTRDKKGNVVDYHDKDVANTVHTFTGGGWNTDQFVKEPMVGKDPRKAFGVEDFSDVCPTILATDYKSPKIVREPMEISFANLPDKTVLQDEDGKGYLWQDGGLWRVRKLVPIEVFRLQDVSDEDAKKIIAVCSKSACYQLAGNSITCAVIFHCFRKLFIDTENESAQKSLFDF